MISNKKRSLFLAVWLFIIISGPVSVLRTTPLADIGQDSGVLVYTFLRMTGLIAYSLLFIQIIIGSKMNYWTQVLGARVYGLHVKQGLLAYAFVLLHPLLNSAFVYLMTGSIVGALVALFPAVGDKRELFMNLGRLSLVLLTIAVGVARMRTHPFFRRNWLFFHYINYVVLFLIFLHARNLGSDISTFPFSVVFYSAPLAVGVLILLKLLKPAAAIFNFGNKNVSTKENN